jgi:hypothetical protein
MQLQGTGSPPSTPAKLIRRFRSEVFRQSEADPRLSKPNFRQPKRSSESRMKVFCVHALVFLLPLAVEVAASAASTELHRHVRRHRHGDDLFRRQRRFSPPDAASNASQWPVKRVAEISGDIVIGGLHMIHEREDAIICGPVMPQGGLQARPADEPRPAPAFVVRALVRVDIVDTFF